MNLHVLECNYLSQHKQLRKYMKLERLIFMPKKDKNITSNMTKADFIAVLAHMTPLEMNKFIEEKGKKPKQITPFIVMEDKCGLS